MGGPRGENDRDRQTRTDRATDRDGGIWGWGVGRGKEKEIETPMSREQGAQDRQGLTAHSTPRNRQVPGHPRPHHCDHQHEATAGGIR